MGTVLRKRMVGLIGLIATVATASCSAAPIARLTAPVGSARNMTSTTPHLVAEYDIPTAASYPRGIAGGPDGNVWFVESKTLKIASVTTTGT